LTGPFDRKEENGLKVFYPLLLKTTADPPSETNTFRKLPDGDPLSIIELGEMPDSVPSVVDGMP